MRALFTLVLAVLVAAVLPALPAHADGPLDPVLAPVCADRLEEA